ncbi:MAG: efflux RND transporter periplasmic adaptor subunit [Vicinamibacterales bacterium]
MTPMMTPVITLRHVTTVTQTRTMLATTLLAAVLLAGCNRATAPAAQGESEVPTLDVTSWTDMTELFMEHPPLVAGQVVRFAVHLTRMADFSALNAGRPAIEMTPVSGGSAVTLPGSDPLRPGAFRVEGTLPAAGQYRWVLLVSAPGLADRHDLGVTTVFGDEASAVADAESRPEGDAAAIAYLKEQQWTNPFATIQVREADVRIAIRVPAAIEPVTGGDTIVGAPADGRYASTTLPSVGDRVSAGQVLGRLEPRLSEGGDDRATLAAAVTEAQAVLDAATADLARAERLLAERAVPGRRVEDARRASSIADARLNAARARLAQRDQVLGSGGSGASGNAFVLRAPIAGRVAEVFASLGASYDEGAPLFRIVRTDEVELQAQMPPGDAPLSRAISGLELEIPGRPDPIVLKPEHVHDAGILDPRTRALPVQIEVDNRDGQLLIGQTGTAVIYTGGTQRVPVVPREAVLMESGRPYVFVQIGGESFGRRSVEITARDGDLVGIRAGVMPGDRVVTRGAYDIQLASAAKGRPAEGHVH